MFGCGNNFGNSNSCCNPCIILLIISIFYYQGLLNTRNCKDNSSRNALVLLFLFWLCSGCCGNNYNNTMNNNVRPYMPYMPYRPATQNMSCIPVCCVERQKPKCKPCCCCCCR